MSRTTSRTTHEPTTHTHLRQHVVDGGRTHLVEMWRCSESTTQRGTKLQLQARSAPPGPSWRFWEHLSSTSWQHRQLLSGPQSLSEAGWGGPVPELYEQQLQFASVHLSPDTEQPCRPEHWTGHRWFRWTACTSEGRVKDVTWSISSVKGKVSAQSLKPNRTPVLMENYNDNKTFNYPCNKDRH